MSVKLTPMRFNPVLPRGFLLPWYILTLKEFNTSPLTVSKNRKYTLKLYRMKCVESAAVVVMKNEAHLLKCQSMSLAFSKTTL